MDWHWFANSDIENAARANQRASEALAAGHHGAAQIAVEASAYWITQARDDLRRARTVAMSDNDLALDGAVRAMLPEVMGAKP